MRLLRAIKLLLTLRCDQSTRLMSDASHRDLTGVELWAVRLHKVGCSYCRQVAEQLRVVDEAARARAAARPAMPDEMRARIAETLADADDRPAGNTP